MAFELNHQNDNGKITIIINKNISKQQMDKICDLVDSILESKPASISIPSNTKYVPKSLGKKLGENPVDSIKLDKYKEPETGVRLKIVGLMSSAGEYQREGAIELGRVNLIKRMRDITNISIIGCMNIIMGNCPCPILSPEIANKIKDEFVIAGVFAKIVPA